MIEANLQVTSGAAAPLFLAFISGDTGVWKTGLRSSSWGGGGRSKISLTWNSSHLLQFSCGLRNCLIVLE